MNLDFNRKTLWNTDFFDLCVCVCDQIIFLEYIDL